MASNPMKGTTYAQAEAMAIEKATVERKDVPIYRIYRTGKYTLDLPAERHSVHNTIAAAEKPTSKPPSDMAVALTYRFNQNRAVHLRAIEGMSPEDATAFNEGLLGSLMALTNPLEFKSAIEMLKERP